MRKKIRNRRRDRRVFGRTARRSRRVNSAGFHMRGGYRL
ncbi:hypothetical protein [Sigmofec virus UA08Rod_6120]|uniref:Uncharacterized protein n=1 Tax=Sigmofec virus UA08Rod_6120 TaxID=2929453 RepID=A0A976R8H4_9VIRU|nr:hypothetical protein [Sigmofec virus UA08Rod_6120]